jgi:hypothetical protein
VQNFFQPTIGPLPGWHALPMTIRATRSQLIWSPVLGWVLLSCAVSAAQAQLSVTTPIGSFGEPVSAPGVPAYLPANPVAPLPSEAGIPTVDSNEVGIAVGAYTLYPMIEINAGYDSNVFAQSPATAAPNGLTASLYTTIAPALDLRSEWLNHAIHVLVGGAVGYYANAPTQNYQNFTLAVDGKLDIYTDVFMTGAIAYRRTTEAIGTPNTAFSQAPTVVEAIPVEVSFYQKFNRFFYQLTGRATKSTYHDFSTITATGLPGASRDRTEYDEALKLGYEVYDDLSFYILPGLNQRRYVEQVNVANQQRDSNGQTIGVGFTWSPNATSVLDGYVGYSTLADASNTGLPPTSSYTFGLTGSWNRYQPLTLRPQISRSIQETALTNYQNFISTVIAMDARYHIHDAWTAIGGVSYTNADYTPYPGLAGPRTDTFIRGSIGLLYALRPQVEIGPVYEYSQASSTDPVAGPAFTRQVFSIRLVAKR